MDLNKIHILLADDDGDDCRFFKAALEELDLSTCLTTLNDGEKLMNYLSTVPDQLPDVLFLDINMPGKNGFECLAEIKKDNRLKDLAVIMFSTSNSPSAISRLFQIGAHVYIHKPGDFTQLKEVIQHALPISAEQRFSNSKVKYILNA